MYISKSLKIILLCAVFLLGVFLVNTTISSNNKLKALGPGTIGCPGEPGNCIHTYCFENGCGAPPGGWSTGKGCQGPVVDCYSADVQYNGVAYEPCGVSNLYRAYNSSGQVVDWTTYYKGDCGGTSPTSPYHTCAVVIRPRYRITLKDGMGQSDWISAGNLSTDWLATYNINQIQEIRHAVFVGAVADNVKFYGRVRLLSPAIDPNTGNTFRVNYYDAEGGKAHVIPAEFFKAGTYNLRVFSHHPSQFNQLCVENSFTINQALACGATGCTTSAQCATGNSCVSGQCRLTQCVNAPGSCSGVCTANTNVACGGGCYNNGVPNSQGTCSAGNLCVQGTNGTYTCKISQCVTSPSSCTPAGCGIYSQCNQACTVPSGQPSGTQANCAPGYVCNSSVNRCQLLECFNGTSVCDSTRCIATCTPTVPAAATLNSPINDARVALGTNNSVNLSFTLNSYGTGCPANNTYTLQMNQVEIGQACGTSWVSYGQVSSASNLLVNKKYCWRILKNNGSRTSLSSVGTFITYVDTASITQNNAVTADVCGNGYSGKLGNTNVSNPIEFNITATKSNTTSTFRELWVAMVATNATNQDVMSLDSIRTKVNTDRTMGFRYVIPSSGAPTVYTMINSGTGWSNTGISANGTAITNSFGTANVIEIGTNTRVTVSTNTLTGRVKMQFNDSHTSSQYNVYAAVIFTGGDGNLYSSDSTTANQFNFRRIPTRTGSNTWGVDLVNPAATVTAPTYNADGTFRISWSATDNLSGMKGTVYSYITATEPNSLINEIGFGNITPIIGTTPAPPTASNGRITTTNLTTKTYRDVRPELGTQFGFIMHVEDVACNKTSTNSQSGGTNPWLLSYKGSVSSNSGVSGIVPSQSNFQIPGTTDTTSNFISTYTLISGNASLPARNLSKYDQYTRNYFNAGALPPTDSGFTTWYDYALNLVQKNLPSGNNRGTLAGPVTFNSGNVSTSQTNANGTNLVLSLPAQTTGNNYVVVNGNATFNSGFICDRTLTIFVTGTVTINPDFNSTGTNCVIISRGNITIQNGSNKTGTVDISSSTLASYDIVNGYFISDGNLVTTTDNGNGVTRKWDGLQITGGVIVKDLVLLRSINLSANTLQPATIVIYDPKYRDVFGTDFSFNKYSVREQGL